MRDAVQGMRRAVLQRVADGLLVAGTSCTTCGMRFSPLIIAIAFSEFKQNPAVLAASCGHLRLAKLTRTSAFPIPDGALAIFLAVRRSASLPSGVCLHLT